MSSENSSLHGLPYTEAQANRYGRTWGHVVRHALEEGRLLAPPEDDVSGLLLLRADDDIAQLPVHASPRAPAEARRASGRRDPAGEESTAALTPWAVRFRYGEVPEEELDRSLTLALLIDLRAWVADSVG